MFSKLVSFLLSPFISAYIRRQESRLNAFSIPLSADLQPIMMQYFSSETLKAVRLAVIDPLPIPDPPFLSIARKCGFAFATPSMAAGITFDTLIVVCSEPTLSLLFHELVHVVQFRLLGVAGFAREYVRGFLQYRNYYCIPLERCAFDLQRRFDAGEIFSAEIAVRAQLRI